MTGVNAPTAMNSLARLFGLTEEIVGIARTRRPVAGARGGGDQGDGGESAGAQRFSSKMRKTTRCSNARQLRNGRIESCFHFIGSFTARWASKTGRVIYRG